MSTEPSSQPSTEKPPRKATFGGMPISEQARDRRGGTKFFDSADWVINPQGQKHTAPSSTEIESRTREEPKDSPLSSIDAAVEEN